MTQLFQSIAEAYDHGLQTLMERGLAAPSVTDPTSVASSFGRGDRPAVELLNYSLAITGNLAPLVLHPKQPIRLEYCLGLFLWSMAGSDAVEWISYYHPDASKFSDDGAHLCGAFGKRLVAHNGGINQLAEIVKRLRVDPPSRRAYAAIITPEDNTRGSREFPCAAGVQYFVRDGTLHAITNMRAQNALTVFRYDCFLFMCIQQVLAGRLGLTPGTYWHNAGTYHFYESDRNHVREMLRSPSEAVSLGEFGAGDELPDLLQLESEIRAKSLASDRDSLLQMATSTTFNSDSFWENTRLLLILYALERACVPVDAARIRDQLSPGLQRLLEATPTRFRT